MCVGGVQLYSLAEEFTAYSNLTLNMGFVPQFCTFPAMA